ncbi:hypothetical protein P153DRAFT_395183 [Dothidotthia symphoricarpi CBS 119687]|uniref:Uncharacterized protein n=1 Tax=Dothidotthia symphoricarpi CBS 119687 TaxID=1392245 RepID=A0A6A6AIM2_9PLEO|nr:uncharacterized protein P153DRAFT_395183 [Dothidotthia symphoricarpi CBS 119687]KAF2130754.1 hypothetical protein P153DRAFT_395183 [Dothidotthia symphoricarpi CBS 119687]
MATQPLEYTIEATTFKIVQTIQLKPAQDTFLPQIHLTAPPTPPEAVSAHPSQNPHYLSVPPPPPPPPPTPTPTRTARETAGRSLERKKGVRGKLGRQVECIKRLVNHRVFGDVHVRRFCGRVADVSNGNSYFSRMLGRVRRRARDGVARGARREHTDTAEKSVDQCVNAYEGPYELDATATAIVPTFAENEEVYMVQPFLPPKASTPPQEPVLESEALVCEQAHTAHSEVSPLRPFPAESSPTCVRKCCSAEDELGVGDITTGSLVGRSGSRSPSLSRSVLTAENGWFSAEDLDDFTADRLVEALIGIGG